ncbi:MAG TPA: hypothetical protein PLP17_00505, partial [Oligoflexia bacterium]|nr:hypothetical protein [Oligoflexia bacterium]
MELLSYFGGELDLRLYSAGQLLIIATGVCLLLAELRRHRVTCLYGSLTYTLGIYVVLGWEFPALKFHWFPFWLALLVRVRRGSSWSSLISAFLCSVIWLVSSGALASFGALAAFILVPFLDYLVLPGEASGAAARPLSRFRKSAFGICCAIAAIGGLVLTPVYTMPDYPPGARLAPVSPLLLNYERPLLGPYIEPNPVVYVEYVAAVQHYALRVFLISLIVILCFAAAYLMRGTKLSKSLCLPAWLILAIVAVIGGEWALQGANSYAAPFPVLARLVPGL